MKVGTDGVLLGAWAQAQGDLLLDIGTGTGLIALMLAQRNGQAEVQAVDIDPAAARQAGDNFALSPWGNRLQAHCADFTAWHTNGMYDEIVSNPPFYQDTLPAATHGRDVARGGSRRFLEGLVGFSLQHLKPQGILEVILPCEVGESFAFDAWVMGLHVQRKTLVRTRPDKPPKRVLLQLGRMPVACDPSELCLLDPDGSRSQAYQQLTADFYL